MSTLNDQEKQFVQSVLGPNCTVHYSTIARFYQATNSQWQYSQKMGALAIVTQGGIHCLKIVDMKTRRIIFEQQLYENFEYKAPVAFFHTFEMDDCVAGFSFASESEAQHFYNTVTQCASNRIPASVGPPPPVRMPSEGSLTISNPVPVNKIQSTPVLQNNNTTSVYQSQASKTSNLSKKDLKKLEKEKKKQEKLEKKNRKKGGGGGMVISGPTNVTHVSSIGWNAQSGFQVRNIPPEWRQLFKQAGVTKKDMQNPETAAFVVGVIEQASRAPPPPPSSAAPLTTRAPPPPPGASGRTPPPPPTGGGRPPPPPPTGGNRPPPPPPSGDPLRPPPRAPATTVQAPPPPPAPAPPLQEPIDNSASAPAAPPPPAVLSSSESSDFGGSSNALLNALQNTKLKAVSERPHAETFSTPPPMGLAETLAKAMGNRRMHIKEDQSDDEDDDWSDDDWN